MLLLCALVAASGSVWADYTTVATFKSADVVTSSGYAAYSNEDWSISVGGNNASVGFNGTASNAKKIGDALGTSANANYYGSVIKSKSKIDNISQITFTYEGTGSGTSGKIYLAYSTDGNTWNALSLSSGTQGASISEDMTFQFEEISSAYYAIILEKGSSTGMFRWDKVTATFDKQNAPKYALTFSNPVGGTISVMKGSSAVASGDEFAEGTELAIVATPASGYDFTSWSATEGATIGSTSEASTTLTMPATAVELTANFTAKNDLWDVELDNTVNGSIERDKNQAKVGETVTLTATPADGYTLGEWSVLGNDFIEVTKTGELTATFVMPYSDVLVSATFLREHTITYYVAGEANTTKRADGSSLNLADASTIGGMPFAGWSSIDNVEAPVFVSNSTVVNSDLTLYAVFIAKEGKSAYNLVETDQSDWRGDYLIAYSSTIFADGCVGGTDGLGKQNTKVSPGNKLNGTVVDATWGDTYNVTLEAINNTDLSKGYLLKTKDGKYNYYTSNNNGLSSSINSATAAAYPISVTFTSSADVKLKLGGNATGAVFRYNTDGFFRFYKNGGQNAVYLYKKVISAPVYSLATPESIGVTAAGMATYVSVLDLDYSSVEGLAAYKAKVEGNAITFTKVTTVPAGEGVLLRALSKLENTTSFSVPVAATAVSAWTDNDFIPGTGEAVPTTDGTNYNYILNNGSAGVGFYKANGQVVGTNRAYLSTTTAPTTGARLTFSFVDEPTGIDVTIVNSERVNGEVYDLQGRKIRAPQKGLYIVNGKKMIVK